jgi:hypothetical protein
MRPRTPWRLSSHPPTAKYAPQGPDGHSPVGPSLTFFSGLVSSKITANYSANLNAGGRRLQVPRARLPGPAELIDPLALGPFLALAPPRLVREIQAPFPVTFAKCRQGRLVSSPISAPHQSRPSAERAPVRLAVPAAECGGRRGAIRNQEDARRRGPAKARSLAGGTRRGRQPPKGVRFRPRPLFRRNAWCREPRI